MARQHAHWDAEKKLCRKHINRKKRKPAQQQPFGAPLPHWPKKRKTQQRETKAVADGPRPRAKKRHRPDTPLAQGAATADELQAVPSRFRAADDHRCVASRTSPSPGRHCHSTLSLTVIDSSVIPEGFTH
jgi:hypothetical protein